MEFHEIWERDLRKKHFKRLVDAFETAERHELHRTAIMFLHRLEAMGAWTDEFGNWNEPTSSMNPIDDAAGADLSAGWEV